MELLDARLEMRGFQLHDAWGIEDIEEHPETVSFDFFNNILFLGIGFNRLGHRSINNGKPGSLYSTCGK